MKKRILIGAIIATILIGCGKVEQKTNETNENVTISTEKNNEASIDASSESDTETREEEPTVGTALAISSDSSLSESVPDLYYDVFLKYCKEEDREKNTFEVVYAALKESGYTITGGLTEDPEEFVVGVGMIGVWDESDYYCGITFQTDDINGDTGKSIISAINFGHFDVGEIDINFDTNYIQHTCYILENGTITDVESFDELDQYVKEKLVG